MIKTSLFAGAEREARIDKLGDTLQQLAALIDFAALAAEVDRVAPRPDRSRGGRHRFRPR
ncbi:hypothetical protein DWG20_01065 [Crenobacter cavernae]|uniref:Uncharacterized protein n=1 Tax=Crenobacter cavernae TaxID=2290923 RepID=A0A345Y2H9_9NEIS|nr:hypothetical protein DWG20_01065 [Crenobacter cavernae]